MLLFVVQNGHAAVRRSRARSWAKPSVSPYVGAPVEAGILDAPSNLVEVDARWILRRGLPDLILTLTEPLAFDAPQIPSENDVMVQARAGAESLKSLLDGFHNAAEDMNMRCTTAGPTASLLLVIAGVLQTSLNKTEWLYVSLLILAGIAVFAAITGLSVAVPFNRIGLAPDPENASAERVALRRKEAWARLASGTATVALLALGAAALLSA